MRSKVVRSFANEALKRLAHSSRCPFQLSTPEPSPCHDHSSDNSSSSLEQDNVSCSSIFSHRALKAREMSAPSVSFLLQKGPENCRSERSSGPITDLAAKVPSRRPKFASLWNLEIGRCPTIVHTPRFRPIDLVPACRLPATCWSARRAVVCLRPNGIPRLPFDNVASRRPKPDPKSRIRSRLLPNRMFCADWPHLHVREPTARAVISSLR